MLAFALCAASAHGQGTLQFTAGLNGANIVPSPGGSGSGQGTFTLDGSLFAGGVTFALGNPPTGTSIHGPALPGNNANALFDMRGPTFVAPDPVSGDPGGLFYDVNRTLTASEISDLSAGLWYVNVRSDSFPNGDIRGQIVLVPEPSTWALMGIGIMSICFRQRMKNK